LRADELLIWNLAFQATLRYLPGCYDPGPGLVGYLQSFPDFISMARGNQDDIGLVYVF
jgi:hypothetical protein